MTLISASEMAALRGVAESGMTTAVSIYRGAPVQTNSGQQTAWTLQTTANGWFYSDPTKTLVVNAGVLADINTVRLFLPVGTDILSGDKVTSGTDEYLVIDTNQEGTHLPLLRCNLRRAE